MLLVAVLPAQRQLPATAARADASTVRMFLARVLPRLRHAGVGYIPVAHRAPAAAEEPPGLRAAGGVLDLAARHHSPLVVASSRGPAGLDAHGLTEASAVRGGPFVYAVDPAARSVTPLAGAVLGPAGPPPTAVRTVWALADRRPSAAAAPPKET